MARLFRILLFILLVLTLLFFAFRCSQLPKNGSSTPLFNILGINTSTKQTNQSDDKDASVSDEDNTDDKGASVSDEDNTDDKGASVSDEDSTEDKDASVSDEDSTEDKDASVSDENSADDKDASVSTDEERADDKVSQRDNANDDSNLASTNTGKPTLDDNTESDKDGLSATTDSINAIAEKNKETTEAIQAQVNTIIDDANEEANNTDNQLISDEANNTKINERSLVDKNDLDRSPGDAAAAKASEHIKSMIQNNDIETTESNESSNNDEAEPLVEVTPSSESESEDASAANAKEAIENKIDEASDITAKQDSEATLAETDNTSAQSNNNVLTADTDVNDAQATEVTNESMKKGARLIIQNITFAHASARLKSSSFSELDKIKNILASNEDMSVEIAGYTDSTGSSNANKIISLARAEAVRNYLITKGISASRLVAKGFGSKDPIADNSTIKGRRNNRRVELQVN